MWEGLARTRRQDQVLHGTAKVANVIFGLIALPLWLIGQLIGGRIRALLMRLERRSTRALPVPPERERSMDALMRDLEAIAHREKPLPLADARRGLADISSFVIAQQREGSVLGYRYPAQFHDHVFDGADGERIAATIALQEAARPALIVVHGIFTSSRFDYVRQIAVRAYYEWGFNVAVLDLRSFGLTEMTSNAPASAGWKEGEDIVALARYLKKVGATSVGALGISYGAGCVLNASDPDEAKQALDGGILAVSPPADPKEAWGRLSEPVPRGHPRYPIHYAFKAMLTSRVRSGRWPPEAESMPRALEVIAAPYYGVDVEEIWRRAAPVNHIADAKVPVLVLHPEDDPIVKVEHARMLADAAAGNELVRVWRLPTGAHGILEAIDSTWTYGVYRTFFERWARYPERERALPAGEDGKVVYSGPDGGEKVTSGG